MRQSLDSYDIMPTNMRKYLQNYGWHFNKALCHYAVSLMRKDNAKLEPVSKEFIDKLLQQYNITLKNNVGYDYIFVANMCKADYLSSSIPDGLHLCLYVKDVIDDVDGYDGIAFNRWYSDMCRKGIQVDWYNCR